MYVCTQKKERERELEEIAKPGGQRLAAAGWLAVVLANSLAEPYFSVIN